jgi:hypothetical protein
MVVVGAREEHVLRVVMRAGFRVESGLAAIAGLTGHRNPLLERA